MAISAAERAGVKRTEKPPVNKTKTTKTEVEVVIEKEVELIGVIWKVKREFGKRNALTKKRLRFSNELIIVECDDCLILYTPPEEDLIKNGVNQLFEVYSSSLKCWGNIIPESKNIYFLKSFYSACIPRGLKALVPSYDNKRMKERYLDALHTSFQEIKIYLDSEEDCFDADNALDIKNRKAKLRSFYNNLKKEWNFGL